MSDNILSDESELITEIIKKYADVDFPTTKSDDSRWEFVDLEKIYLKQKNIFDLRCIVLSHTPVSHIKNTIGKPFSKCIELDLTSTKISKWSQLFEIISYFPNLKTLHLSHTHLEPLLPNLDVSLFKFPALSEISLINTSVSSQTADAITTIFTELEEIYLAINGLCSYTPKCKFEKLRKIDLQNNEIRSFSNISLLQSLPNLEFLNVSSCKIQRIEFDESPGFVLLSTLLIQDNPIEEWESIYQLSKLPSLKKLIIKGTKLCGTNGLDVRELIIAKMPNLLELDRCDISDVSRRSTELYVHSHLTKGPIDPLHKATIQRLSKVYGLSVDNSSNNLQKRDAIVNSRLIFLEYADKKVQRNLSIQLSIHRIVAIASKLFDFDPDDIDAVELRRSGLLPERLKRTKDSLLDQFNMDDGDSIAFLTN